MVSNQSESVMVNLTCTCKLSRLLKDAAKPDRVEDFQVSVLGHLGYGNHPYLQVLTKENCVGHNSTFSR